MGANALLWGLLFITVLCRSVAGASPLCAAIDPNTKHVPRTKGQPFVTTGQTCSGEFDQIHSIKESETIYAIVNACGTLFTDFKLANPQIPDLNFVRVGQEVCVPTGCSTTLIGIVPSPAYCQEGTKPYSIQKGDTIDRLTRGCSANVTALNPQLSDPANLALNIQVCIPSSCVLVSLPGNAPSDVSVGAQSSTVSSPPKIDWLLLVAVVVVTVLVTIAALWLLCAVGYCCFACKMERTYYSSRPPSSLFKAPGKGSNPSNRLPDTRACTRATSNKLVGLNAV